MTVRDVVEAQGDCRLFDAGEGLGQGGCIVQGVMQQVGLPGFHGGEAGSLALRLVDVVVGLLRLLLPRLALVQPFLPQPALS